MDLFISISFVLHSSLTSVYQVRILYGCVPKMRVLILFISFLLHFSLRFIYGNEFVQELRVLKLSPSIFFCLRLMSVYMVHREIWVCSRNEDTCYFIFFLLLSEPQFTSNIVCLKSEGFGVISIS